MSKPAKYCLTSGLSRVAPQLIVQDSNSKNTSLYAFPRIVGSHRTLFLLTFLYRKTAIFPLSVWMLPLWVRAQKVRTSVKLLRNHVHLKPCAPRLMSHPSLHTVLPPFRTSVFATAHPWLDSVWRESHTDGAFGCTRRCANYLRCATTTSLCWRAAVRRGEHWPGPAPAPAQAPHRHRTGPGAMERNLCETPAFVGGRRKSWMIYAETHIAGHRYSKLGKSLSCDS